MNKRFIEKLAISALLGGALWAAPLSVQAADESSQVLMLRRVFATSVEYWPDILKKDTKLLDKSFFERIEARLKWSIDNGQIEDAVRFAYVGDLAGRIVNHKTTYRMQMAQLFRKIGNYSMAMDVINNVCITEPDNNDAIFYRASLLQDGGDNVRIVLLGSPGISASMVPKVRAPNSEANLVAATPDEDARLAVAKGNTLVATPHAREIPFHRGRKGSHCEKQVRRRGNA